MFRIEQVKKTFQSGISKSRWLIPFKICFLGLLGVLLILYALWVSPTDVMAWLYRIVLLLLGISLAGRQLICLLHRETLDPYQYMLKFLDGKHNTLAWIYLSADKEPDDKNAAEFETDRRAYWLCFWFTNKTCCKVYGKKAALDSLMLYFRVHYPDVTTGYSQEIAARFAKDPHKLKEQPAHVSGASGKQKPPVFRTQRIFLKIQRPFIMLNNTAHILGTIFWFCVSFSVSVYFLSSFGYQLYLSSACASWPSVQGTVSYVYSYEEKIDYSYEVEGFGHTSSRISFSDPEKDWAEKYPIDSTVTVYYEPSNPYQSVLEPSALGFSGFISLFLGLLFIGIGWVCFNWGRGRYKTIIDPVYWT